MTQYSTTPDPSRGLRTAQSVYRSLAVITGVLTLLLSVLGFFVFSQDIRYTYDASNNLRVIGVSDPTRGLGFALLIAVGGFLVTLPFYTTAARINLALRMETDLHYAAQMLYEAAVASRETADLLRARLGRPVQDAEPPSATSSRIRRLPK